jgi:hypothetical protein
LPYWLWFLCGGLLVAGTQAGFLSTRDWNPTALLQVGTVSPAKVEIGRDFPNLLIVPTSGHDGKYFYLIARHPWPGTLNAETKDGLQDPAYRFGRPLYPLLAGLLGSLPPRGVLAGLLAVQVLAGGGYLIAIVAIARRMGLPAWAVWVGAANPAVYSSAVLLTSDSLALALVMGGMHYWLGRRTRIALAFFALAALTKEYYLLTPVSLGLLSLRRFDFRQAAWLLTVPLAPIAGWKLLVWSYLGKSGGAENFTWPGVGVATAAGQWGDAWSLEILALLVLAGALAGVVIRSNPVPRWQCAAWVALGLLTSPIVWSDPADGLRVLAPLWWFVLWAIAGRRSGLPRP